MLQSKQVEIETNLVYLFSFLKNVYKNPKYNWNKSFEMVNTHILEYLNVP